MHRVEYPLNTGETSLCRQLITMVISNDNLLTHNLWACIMVMVLDVRNIATSNTTHRQQTICARCTVTAN